MLRPDGSLIFLTNSTLLALCAIDAPDAPATNQLVRPSFGLHRIEWTDDNSVEFNLSHGDWMRLLRDSGLEIEDLIEVYPDSDSVTTYQFVTPEWARQWPSEEVWKARKRG